MDKQAGDLFKLRRGQGLRSKETLDAAFAAVRAGDLHGLESARLAGFNPWRRAPAKAPEKAQPEEAVLEWARQALREPSGRSLKWLAESFNGFLGDLPSCDVLLRAGGDGAREFALVPVLAVFDMYRPQGEALASSLRHARQMEGFEELLDRLLERPWFERYWKEPVADKDEAFVRHGQKHGWDYCAEMAAHGQRNGMSADAIRRLTELLLKRAPSEVNQKSLRHALAYEAAEGADIEPFHRLAELLTDQLDFSSASNRLNKGPREQWRERVLSFLSQRFFGLESELDLGMCVLLGGQPESIRCALEQGWIRPLKLDISIGCESPYYAAYEKARLEEQQGRSLDMSARFEKIRRVIKASEAPPEKKAELLSALDSAPKACPPKDQWRLSLPSSMMMSPQVVVMGRSVERDPSKGEAAAAALSEGGFLLSEAVEQAKWIGCAQKEKRPSWLNRALEREAIRLAAGPARDRVKRAAL